MCKCAFLFKGSLNIQEPSTDKGHETPVMEPPLSSLARSRRNAVSASVMSEEDATNYVKKVSSVSLYSFIQ